jgi:stearoyl-CoA desaturase (delta-9 desaturase)
MMGEAYHNNHHKHGGRANFGGVRWHEMDVTYQIMLLLDKMKLIKLNPVAVVKREHYNNTNRLRNY